MATPTEQLDQRLDELQGQLPGLIERFPPHDPAFWLEFTRRAGQLQQLAEPGQQAHVARRIFHMLEGNGLVPPAAP